MPKGLEWPCSGCSTSPEAGRPVAAGTGVAARAVDVVILTWNDGPLLQAAVDSVLAQEGVEPHVVVVDNASDTPPDLIPHEAITLVRNIENRGVAAARNQGVAIGDSPSVLILDSDAMLEPGCVDALSSALDADPSIALAAPVFVGQPPEASAGCAPSVARKVARGLGLTAAYRGVRRDGAATQWPVDFAIGACQLVRRDAWERVGGLDESYFYGPEDLDFCLRLAGAGLGAVQVAAARCHHPPRRRHRSLFAPGGLRHAGAIARHYARGWRP